MKKVYKIPSNINKEAKKYMATVLKQVKSIADSKPVDDGALDMLAYNYSLFFDAMKIIIKEGVTFTDEKGYIKPHPAVAIARSAQSSCIILMQEFGLTVKSRNGLKKSTMEVPSNPLEQFVKNAKLV